MTRRRVALVTGANRGIGFEICRQLGEAGLIVVVTARDAVRGRRAVAELARHGHEFHYCPLDVTDVKSIEQAKAFVEREFARLDVLVNNAAISKDRKYTVLDVDLELCHETFEVNFFGPLRLCRAWVPLMKRNGYGRIVNVSSGRGSFTKLAAEGACYRISKTALNALTCVLADELRGTGILVNAMTPGWVRTRLGGLRAPRSVSEGADTAVWLATLPDDGPHGRFFKDKEEFPW
ncbi:MAG: SDR family oxidoreductase [bacterium]|nr:SDR family oxidoreductase [bacterium]